MPESAGAHAVSHADSHASLYAWRGTACHRSMRSGGTHSMLAARHVLTVLRRREPPSRLWADLDETLAAADTNCDGRFSEHELVAVCVAVGPDWSEFRVRDVLRNCL